MQLKTKAVIREMKRQDTDWEKIFAKRVSDKGLVSGTHEELDAVVETGPTVGTDPRRGRYAHGQVAQGKGPTSGSER